MELPLTVDLGLRTNAFWVLGLSTSASLPEILGRADELRVLLDIKQMPSYPSDGLAFSPPERTLEAVAAAVKRLDDPSTRLFDEAIWFHVLDPIDHLATAALAEGKLRQAKALWEGAASQAPDGRLRLHFQHNLAVVDLCEAEIARTPRPSSPNDLTRILAAWTPLLSSEAFWRHLVAQSPAGRDPRCQASTPREVCDAIGRSLAGKCSRQTVEALKARRIDEARAWAGALTESRLPVEFAAEATEKILEAVGQLVRDVLEPVEDALHKASERSPDVQTLEDHLLFACNTFDQFKSLAAKPSPFLQASGDRLAETYRSLALYYVNQANNSEKAVELVETAARLAASESVRIRLKQDARTLHWNIATNAFAEVVVAKDYPAAEREFAALEKYRDPAGGLEVLEPFKEALRNLRILRGCQPITQAPSLFTVNGIGTKLYGRSEDDPETGTYLATRFFTFFYIPLLALGRYRVQDLGDGSYRFFGRAPVSKGHWAWNAVVVGAALAGLLSIAGQETLGPMSRTSPTTRPAEVPRSVAVPRADSRSALRAEIQRRRPVIEAERAALEIEGGAIDREQKALDSLRARIEARRALYPEGLPPDEYERDRQAVAEYNRRFRSLRSRMDTHNSRGEALGRDIEEFNTLVNRYNTSR